MKSNEANKSFTEAASQRAKRQVKTHLNRKSEKRACIINPRFSEKPRLSENDGAVLDIKKRFGKMG